MNYWLFKSEPDVFGIQHLGKRPKQTEHWDGVRNYQARNFMRDNMRVGDLGFFYHSSCAEPGVTGIIEIVRAGYPDHTAFDPENSHYDPRSTREKPVWYMVDVRLKRAFSSTVTLQELKNQPALKDMKLLARGNRLSVMPLTKREWDYIVKLGRS
jgi:predicted RNA-binding protein with PUA-like domain